MEWYRPRIRLPYFDNNGIEHGYFPDFYIKNYNCFIEVKSNFIANYQNRNNKISYIKEHYKFVKWLETEEACKTFILSDLGCNFTPPKDEEDIDYWLKVENTRVQKSQKGLLKENRWEIIKSSDIDFTKYGWVNQIAKLFGIRDNKAGIYIKNNFPDFYKNCYVRKSQ